MLTLISAENPDEETDYTTKKGAICREDDANSCHGPNKHGQLTNASSELPRVYHTAVGQDGCADKIQNNFCLQNNLREQVGVPLFPQKFIIYYQLFTINRLFTIHLSHKTHFST